MKSKDIIQQQLKENLVQAFKENNEDAIAVAFANFAESVQQNVLEEFQAYQKTADTTILAKRGLRQLTSEETKFYQSVISAMKSNDVRQAFTGLDNAYPETVINSILEDIKAAHPLLAAINFQNTSLITKFLVNKQGAQLAQWGPLNSTIAKELSGAIGLIDLTLCKLSAYMPISKDMLAVGPEWLDAYVRSVLSEAIADALEIAIVNGTGKDEPIGMNRSVADNVTITGGVYPKKTKKVITNLSAETYGEVLATLAMGPNSKSRVVSEVIFLVNPVDYYKKIMPSSTVRGTDGTFRNNIFPFPTKCIPSIGVDLNEAVMGIAPKYFMGIGAGSTGGKIEYSDEFKFLEDQRVYLTKLYGNGRAMDDNAFVLLDITNLTPATVEVAVTNIVKTKEQV